MRDGRAPAALIGMLGSAFVAVGVTVASLGPALPEFASVAGIDVSSIGVLYSALFGGFLVSQITATVLLERTGTRVTILAALVVLAAGTTGLAVANGVTALLTASAVLGLGYGFGTIGINLVASRLVPHRPAFVVNFINVLFGVGSVLGPVISSAMLRSGGQARWVPAVGGLTACALLPWAWMVLPRDARVPLREVIPPAPARALPVALLLMGVLVFLYGGVESGFSGWAPTYLERTLGLSPAGAALAVSLYWLAYLCGRIVSTALAFRIAPAVVLEGSLLVLMAGGLVLALSVGHQGGTTVALVLLGGATGPIYPSMFGVVTQRFAERAAFAVSAVSAIGCGGAMLLPWVMGLTLPIGNGRVLATIPILLALGMWVAYRQSARGSTSGPLPDAAASSRP